MKKRILAGLAIGLLMLGVTPGVHAASASFSINSVNWYGNSYYTPQSAGYVFTPQSDIIVDSLGFFDYLGDGLGESHKVGIFESMGTLLSSAVIQSGTSSQLIEDFRYTDIVPLTLLAGQNYTVAALFLTNADVIGYADVEDIQVNSAISLDSLPARYILHTGTDLEFPTETALLVDEMFYGPNFRLTPVPVPTSILLIGTGMAGLVGLRLRRKRKD